MWADVPITRERVRRTSPPSPPAKRITARQDQAGQPVTVPSGNGKVENQRVTRCGCTQRDGLCGVMAPATLAAELLKAAASWIYEVWVVFASCYAADVIPDRVEGKAA